jgi:hypothetical protein
MDAEFDDTKTVKTAARTLKTLGRRFLAAKLSIVE